MNSRKIWLVVRWDDSGVQAWTTPQCAFTEEQAAIDFILNAIKGKEHWLEHDRNRFWANKYESDAYEIQEINLHSKS